MSEMKHRLVFGPIDASAFEPLLQNTRPCRRCSVLIHFMRTAAGASMPVDQFPVKITRQDVEEGLESSRNLFSIEGRIRLLDIGEIGFVPHWVTCPHAGEFKREKPPPLSQEKLLEILRGRIAYIEKALGSISRQAGASIQLQEGLKELHKYAKRTLKMMEEPE